MAAGLFMLSVEDVRHKKISLFPIIIMGMTLMGLALWEGKDFLFIFIGLIPGLMAMLLSVLTKGGMGMGDAVLLMAVGVYLGLWDGLAVLMLGLLLSSLTAIILLVLRKAHLKTELPFVPFYFGGIVVWEVFKWLF